MTSQKKVILATLAAILIVSTAVFVILEMSQKEAYGQQISVIPASRERTVSSTGSATVSVLPDIVTVQFGVDTEAKTAQDAINSNSQMMNTVVSAIENIGITKDEISTAGFSIYPVYQDSVPDPNTGIHKSVLTGYQTSNTLYVKTTKLSMAGNIVDTAVAAGANRVDNISFLLSPEKEQSIQDDLLSKAVLNAKSRAETAIDPLGQKIIGVKMVTLSDFNSQPPPIYPGAMSTMAEKSTPIFTSNQQVTTTVSVIFLIGDQ
ncbi:MAG: SIMPL domain-containing protein [Candidatus Nitrosotalea sp.]|nr:SIMPL domain-containing protein [Candidatus Nitrosotalea sp.]